MRIRLGGLAERNDGCLQIHRTLNVLAVVLIVIAAFCIYFYKGFEWTGPSVGQDAETNTQPNAIHSLVCSFV